ncbi:carboxypeptidase PM20D1 [Quadrisphaera granulorum]|uniref:Carboxypeptidase PM20D1 n=1 Tax=Quadrisphaera granulorum TaxID=317664 RepID=A0A316A5Y0_9ACTN|nr:M20/M25/M40 family metallo-hydrolase [Quadrisphaera granulorum]PWJ52892.1 carboxypeptidase PM20D1 [Quadrisphaera granulorum]SZE97274.1 carboxypeptidase PM20D1 [Quadrisphaera granulorum]
MSPSGVDPVAALQAAVRTTTTAGAESAFAALHEVLVASFSRAFAQLERVEVPGFPHALLLRWPGAGGASGEVAPLVLMAHQDVVPAGSLTAWTHPPFAGVLAPSAEGEAVWGRGTLDDKGPLVVVLAAVEALLAEGFVPARDVWLSFGSDEETGGASAVAAVEVLRRRGARPWAVLDEGGAVAGGALPGLRAPLAVVGVTEKGSTVLRLVACGRGGHASTPARSGPVARLATAVVALERAERRAALGSVTLPAATRELLRRVLPPPLGGLAARFPEVAGRLLVLAGPESAAMVRTTLAFTAMHGSQAVNVVPDEAWVGVNARVMVGDSVDDVVARIRRVVARCGVDVEIVERGEPSPTSPFSGADPKDDEEAFALIERCTAQVFPDAVSTPYVVMAATDARAFAGPSGISDRVYRFSPLRMSRAQRASIHGVDEHVAVADLHDGVRWTTALLRGLP